MNTFKLTALAISIGALAGAAPAKAGAATNIKFATLAPEGSTWMNVMKELDAELQEKTGGQLKFKMYPGGISGDEKDVVKKVRIGQLHAAGFTGVGLGEIAPEARILDAPWLFRDASEADYIYKKFDKELAGAIEKAGYILLGWTELGRVYVFSKDPIDGPESMKRAKMWVWEGDPIAQAAYKAVGVSPIPLSVVDVMSSLQSGLIDAVYGPPMGVVALQWFTKCRHIYALPMADSAGAVLISKKFFDSLPADQRQVLRQASAKHLRRLTILSRQENEAALESLQKQGLKLSAKPTPEALKRYQDLGRAARRELAGKLYSSQLLDQVEKALESLRNGEASTSGTTKKS